MTLTKNQMAVMADALESYSRLLAGQVDNGVFSMAMESHLIRNKIPKSDAAHALSALKRAMFPDLMENESMGIGSRRLADEAQIAHELYKMMGYQHWLESGQRSYSVMSTPPLKYSKEPLIKIEEIADGKKS